MFQTWFIDMTHHSWQFLTLKKKKLKKPSWMKSHKVKYDRWQKEIQSTTTHFRWETFQSINNPVVITSWLCAQKLELNSHIVVQPNMSSVKVLWLNLLLEGSKVSTPNILHFLFFFLFIETKMSFSVTGGNGLLQPREKYVWECHWDYSFHYFHWDSNVRDSYRNKWLCLS